MHLSPRERERLDIFLAAQLARRRLARGQQLNAPEAVAVLCDEVLELAWDGIALPDILTAARAVLSPHQLRPGVPELVPQIQVEALFPSGTALVAISEPFGPPTQAGPGSLKWDSSPIELNAGRPITSLEVHNAGRRAVFVSSHFPFAEVNRWLEFDRVAATGRRLNIAAGTSVSFPPGATLTVELISLDVSGDITVEGTTA